MDTEHIAPAPAEPHNLVALSGAMPRQRVIKRIAEAGSCPIILIIAPAGFGKTTALIHTLVKYQTAILIKTPRAATMETFIDAFAHCCSQQFPEMGAPPHELDARSTDVGVNLDLYIAWAARNLRNAQCIIAVDDLHNADSDKNVSSFLSALADSSKGSIQWIFSSRTQSHLPITRWQIHGEADAPVTADDLRMTLSDAIELATFLKSPATCEDLDAWVLQTQGFPVPLAYAIRLSARRGSVGGIIDGMLSVTFDFLAEQIWASLTPHECALLEVAAFLPALHLHLYEVDGIDSASTVISHLCNEIAFLNLTFDGTFSMHDLFRDFIRQRVLLSGLRNQQTRYACAINILLTNQQYESLFELLIEAEDVDNLIRIVEKVPSKSISLSITHEIIQATSRVAPTQFRPEMLYLHTSYYSWFGDASKSRWLAEEIIARNGSSSRHLLCAISSIYRLIEFQQSDEQLEFLLRIQALIDRLDEASRLAALAIKAALLARFPARRDEAFQLVERVKSQSDLLEPGTRISTLLLLSTALLHIDEVAYALQISSEAVSTARQTNDIGEIARTLNHFGTLLDYTYDPQVEMIFEPLRDAVEKTGSWRYSQLSHWLPAKYYALKGDTDLASQAFRLQSAAVVTSEWQKQALAHLQRRSKNLCHLVSGDFSQVIDDFLTNALPNRSDAAYEITVDAATSYAILGNETHAESILKRARTLRDSLSRLQLNAADDVLMLEIIAYCAIGRWQQGKRLHQSYQRDVPRLRNINASLALFCEGPPFIGLETLLQPCLGQPYIALAASLMTRVAERCSQALPSIRLTAAEADVLRLIGLGKSNKEIAVARSRSTETVKRQAASLFRKLGVESRTGAIAKARELGLQ